MIIREVLSEEILPDKNKVTNGAAENKFPMKVWLLMLPFILLVGVPAMFAALIEAKLNSFQGPTQPLVNNHNHSISTLQKFPISYEVFVPKMHEISSTKNAANNDNDVIPVFFDWQGNDSDFILTTLNECFNMKKKVSLKNYDH